jgi:hypothetical protein
MQNQKMKKTMFICLLTFGKSSTGMAGDLEHCAYGDLQQEHSEQL